MAAMNTYASPPPMSGRVDGEVGGAGEQRENREQMNEMRDGERDTDVATVGEQPPHGRHWPERVHRGRGERRKEEHHGRAGRCANHRAETRFPGTVHPQDYGDEEQQNKSAPADDRPAS